VLYRKKSRDYRRIP